MNASQVSREEFIEVYNNIKEYPTLKDVGEYFGLTKIQVRDKAQYIRKNEDVLISRKTQKAEVSNQIASIEELLSSDQKLIRRLSEENKALKKTVEEVKQHIFTTADLKDIMSSVNASDIDTTPKWYNTKSKTNDVLVPVLFLTDTHIGEVIDHRDMGFNEDYNSEIAERSINKLTEDFIDICTVKMSNYKYEGAVLLLGGDMITGNLHDLSETNDLTPVEQVIKASSILIQQVKKLKQAFGKVQVFAVSGNHGRLDAHNYTKMKKRLDNSLESLVYYYINEHFKDDEQVNFTYDKADEILFGINGRKFLLTHGDRGIKGGSGIGGIAVPVKRARAKMLQGYVAMGKDFDTLIIGHFHTHHVSDDIIIGASTKPFDEYCKSSGFEFNSPGATMFFVNTHSEMIYATKLVVRNENKTKVQRKKSLELF